MKKWNRKFSISAGVTILLAAFIALIMGAAHSGAINAEGANKCTLKTIRGTWVFREQGMVKDAERVVPWAAAGVWIFDGAGYSDGLYSASMNGEAIDRQKVFTATYELKSGCVFRSVDSLGIVYDIYAIDQGTTATYFAAGVSGTLSRR